MTPEIAEQALLCTLLIDKEAIYRVLDVVTEEDFNVAKHGLVFATAKSLVDKGMKVDMVSVIDQLQTAKKLEDIGGRTFLMQLTTVVPTSVHAEQYAKLIADAALKRRVKSAARSITELNEELSAEDISEAAERAVFEAVKLRKEVGGFKSMQELADAAFEAVSNPEAGWAKRRIPTGFTSLDEMLGGFNASDLIVLAARPSVGKTSLALDIARRVAAKGPAVAMFSLEMSKEQLFERVLCAHAGVDLWKLRNQHLLGADLAATGQAFGQLASLPLHIDDAPGLSVQSLRTRLRRLMLNVPVKFVIVDYMQLMESPARRKDGRVQEVTEISRGLKLIAKEFDVPVLVLSQLNRMVEMTKPAIPKLSHLRESGSIEQDADVVMFIYRKATDKGYKTAELPLAERFTADIFVAKHRNGPTGVTHLCFHDATASFREMNELDAIMKQAPATQQSVSVEEEFAPFG